MGLQRLTSVLTQTCVGCGDEIGACSDFVRDKRDEPWHTRCRQLAVNWLGEAIAESRDWERQALAAQAELAAEQLRRGEWELRCLDLAGELAKANEGMEENANGIERQIIRGNAMVAEINRLTAELAKSAAVVAAAKAWAYAAANETAAAEQALLAAVEAAK